MADPSSDIVILGAGVLGLAVAAELTARGHACRVIDPGGPNASSVAAGMIAPAFESLLDEADAARAELLRDAAALWPVFAAAYGLTLDPSPAVWRGPDSDRVADRLTALGFRMAPGTEGLCALDDVRIEPLDAAQTLRRPLADQWITGVAQTLEPKEAAWRVHTPHKVVDARAIVLATGAALPPVGLPKAAARAAGVVRPIAGQIGAIDRRLTDRVLRGPDGYVVPARGGSLIGATMVEGQFRAEVDPVASARLIAQAEGLLGRPVDAPVAWRAAVRGATPDDLPLAGPAGQGIHLALAPRRNGWLLAPLVAQIVADAIEGRPRGVHAATLDPLRFSRQEA